MSTKELSQVRLNNGNDTLKQNASLLPINLKPLKSMVFQSAL